MGEKHVDVEEVSMAEHSLSVIPSSLKSSGSVLTTTLCNEKLLSLMFRAAQLYRHKYKSFKGSLMMTIKQSTSIGSLFGTMLFLARGFDHVYSTSFLLQDKLAFFLIVMVGGGSPKSSGPYYIP